MQNQKYLLPIGFYDLLGDEAKINQETIDILLNSFYAAGYHLIKTPLVEFEESLIGNANCWQKIDDQSFKMVDNFSGKTLVLRSDITPQIARLMATKLQNIYKDLTPIRLCYVGDVLKIKNDNLYADRQLTQVGIELIGESISKNYTQDSGQNSRQDFCAANLEVVDLTILALRKIKLSNLMINFCCPQFLNILLSELKIDDKNLQVAIAKKNISAIKDLGGKYSDDLIKLVLENNDFVKIISIISALPIGEAVLLQLSKWQKTIENVQKNHCADDDKIKFSIDIFGDEEFSYHNQIGFTIFANNFSYPIARGGRYLINQDIPAVGSTIYINNLRKILTK